MELKFVTTLKKYNIPDFKKILCILAFTAVVICIYSICYLIGILDKNPLKSDLIVCDVFWYDEIKRYGYHYVPHAMCNMAFFPLFPYFWKYSSLSAIGISVLNLSIFVISYGVLVHDRKYSLELVLAVISIPSSIFFAIPYSESIFFLFSVIILFGYKRNSVMMVSLGLLGACMTRSVGIFFMPIIILTEISNYLLNDMKERVYPLFSKISIYMLACGIPIIVVAYIQYEQTGLWFYYLEVQQYWGRHFQFPGFPLTTNAPERVMGVDAAAFVVSLITIFLVIRYFIKLIIKKKSNLNPPPKSVIFSILYICAIGFLDVIYTDDLHEQTKIWSINRHLFCTAFFVEFILWYNTSYIKDKIDKLVLVILVVIGLAGTILYQYPLQVVYYICFFVTFVFSCFLANQTKTVLNVFCFSIIIIFNTILFIIYYDSFFKDLWVG